MRVNDAEADELLTDAINRERERCAKLCALRADICRASANSIRDKGTFYGSTLHLVWPFVRSRKFVMSKWETHARELEAVAHAFDMVTRGIREGWDPANLRG